MSRAAVYDTILADARLIALGFDVTNVLPNYDSDQRPNDVMFMILHYDPETDALRSGDGTSRNFKNLTIWVHMYKEYSTDFGRIDRVLDILDNIAYNMVHVDGADGYTVTQIDQGSRSRDMRDDVYQTICRSISYKILSRQTVSV